MNNDDSPQRDLREHIASVIRTLERPPRVSEISHEELQKLKTAANRLDQMLRDAADANQQSLKNAAARLDQLLADIRTGKEVTLKRRRDLPGKDE